MLQQQQRCCRRCTFETLNRHGDHCVCPTRIFDSDTCNTGLSGVEIFATDISCILSPASSSYISKAQPSAPFWLRFSVSSFWNRYGRKIGDSVELQETQGIAYGVARVVIGWSQVRNTLGEKPRWWCSLSCVQVLFVFFSQVLFVFLGTGSKAVESRAVVVECHSMCIAT